VRSSRAQNAWIVEIAADSASRARSRSPSSSRRARTRERISAAARSVKVIARMRSTGTPSSSTHARKRSTRTRVLPVPAPARTHSGPSPRSTAPRCSFVRGALAIRPPPGRPTEIRPRGRHGDAARRGRREELADGQHVERDPQAAGALPARDGVDGLSALVGADEGVAVPGVDAGDAPANAQAVADRDGGLQRPLEAELELQLGRLEAAARVRLGAEVAEEVELEPSHGRPYARGHRRDLELALLLAQ